MRRQQGLPGFTVLCCDNLPHNGISVKAACLDFAARIDGTLARWIERDVAFPSTMVDRISPERTDEACHDAQALIGCQDCAAVSTEPFHQWVVEDSFVHGCPDWTAGGAMLVDDVRPREQMKLCMLNGAHSLIACCSVPAGIELVRDACDVPPLAALTRRHLTAAIGTCAGPHGIDLGQYAEQILKRFRTPSFDHMTAQIAMDGSEKMPQRILGPAISALTAGHDIRPFAFSTAAWLHYCRGRRDDGSRYRIDDSREDGIRQLCQRHHRPADPVSAWSKDPKLIPAQLASDPSWNSLCPTLLQRTWSQGCPDPGSARPASNFNLNAAG